MKTVPSLEFPLWTMEMDSAESQVSLLPDFSNTAQIKVSVKKPESRGVPPHTVIHTLGSKLLLFD